MILDIVMPKGGLTMVEGMIAEWKVEEGSRVKKGDTLMEYENEKSTIEMTSLGSGLIHITALRGDTIGIGERIGYLAETQEEYQFLLAGGTSTSSQPAEETKQDAAPVVQTEEKGCAQECPTCVHTAEPQTMPATVPQSPSSAASATAPAAQSGRVRASGLARKMAAKAGLDLALVPSKEGRVQAKDVDAYLQSQTAVAAAPASVSVDNAVAAVPASVSVDDVVTEIPWIGIKKTIARNMMSSMQTTAQSTCMVEVDMTDLLTLRKKLADNEKTLGYRPSVTDLLCKMLGKILVNHPKANATFDGKTLYTHSHVHLSVAVATEDGLMVPVVRNIDMLNLREIHHQIKTLAQLAKDKKLPMDAQSGGTCMVTNFGVFSMDFSTPILNAPQTCIIGFGRTVLKPAVIQDGTIGARQMMHVTITMDHQVIDGMEAGRIFGDIEQYLKNPELILA
jgi:pyruvate/2-oxoglutarate dehydrogenase complex dihydrolipoamide acyltransferase (E2) component